MFYPKYYDDGNDEDTDDEDEIGALIYQSSATAKAIAKAKTERESTTSNVSGINQYVRARHVAESIIDDGETELPHQLQRHQLHRQEKQKNLPTMMDDASHVATLKQSSPLRPINIGVKTPWTNIYGNEPNAFSSLGQQKTSIPLNQEEWKPDQQECTPSKENKASQVSEASQTRKTFSDFVADLKSYKEKHGHLNVSIVDDKTLAKFCLIIRWARRNPAKAGALQLDKDHISSLDAIGFTWDPKPKMKSVDERLEGPTPKMKSVDERLEDLKVYKEKHGHINVSDKEDKALNKFCRRIRWSRKHPGKSGSARLTEDRIAFLDALGFDWSPQYRHSTRTTFDERLEDLKAYKEKHGHLLVSKAQDKRLATFCSELRFVRRQHGGVYGRIKLTSDRIARLDAIGFPWDYQRRKI